MATIMIDSEKRSELQYYNGGAFMAFQKISFEMDTGEKHPCKSTYRLFQPVTDNI